MMNTVGGTALVQRGILGRLRRDVRGNTLVMMAAAMIPMAAIGGSAIDMARLYVVKSRMQQACDAGVLAGRKFMVDSTSSTLDLVASTQAQLFFGNNFRSGWMSTNPAKFVPTKTSTNRVAGTAQVVVPMTLMKMFNAPDITLNVTCEARYDIADTDVMFILDTTGSMACLPSDSDSACSSYVGSAGSNTYTRPGKGSSAKAAQTSGYTGSTGYSVPEKSGSRIAALRQAVTDFYDTMAANVQATARVRYGFVTYSSSVNAGAAVMQMSSSHMIGSSAAGKSVNYQSRSVTGDFNDGSAVVTTNSLSKTNCTASTVRSPLGTTAQPFAYAPSTSRATIATQYWNGTTTKCTVSTQTVGPVYTYQQVPLNVASYITGSATADPTEVNGSTSSWLGCVEERKTTPGVSSFTTASLPADLDPDLVPNSDDTRWRPLWPDVEYMRYTLYYNSRGQLSSRAYSTDPVTQANDGSTADQYAWLNMNTVGQQQKGWVTCGKPVQRIDTLTKQQVSDYVNAADFVPLGGTYHDVGMIWGTRMLSRLGVFASDNQAAANRDVPKQVIVFLTDGDMAPSPYLYGQYGMEFWDQRVTDGNATPSQKDYHNARFLAECAKAQDMGIDVWTVSIAPSATNELTQCASSPAQALFTTNGDDLREYFKTIAKQVARLRLSK